MHTRRGEKLTSHNEEKIYVSKCFFFFVMKEGGKKSVVFLFFLFPDGRY